MAEFAAFGAGSAVGGPDVVVGIGAKALEEEGAVAESKEGSDGVGALVLDLDDGALEGFFAAVEDGSREGAEVVLGGRAGAEQQEQDGEAHKGPLGVMGRVCYDQAS